MGNSVADAGRRVLPSLTSPSAHLQPLAAVFLAAGLTLAIVTDGLLPDYWTKALLALVLPLNIVTAYWLTRPRS